MIQGRPLQYDPDQALSAAMQVFWSQGYEATSLQDLLAAMGLSKSSFYQGFGGKKALFLRCIERYTRRVSERLAALLQASPSGLAFIETFLLHAATEARQPEHLRRGCLLINSASEFAQNDAQVARQVAAGFRGLREVLTAAVQRGQNEGSIAADQTTEALAAYLVCSLGGLKTVVKGGADETEVKQIVGVILKALG